MADDTGSNVAGDRRFRRRQKLLERIRSDPPYEDDEFDRILQILDQEGWIGENTRLVYNIYILLSEFANEYLDTASLNDPKRLREEKRKNLSEIRNVRESAIILQAYLKNLSERTERSMFLDPMDDIPDWDDDIVDWNDLKNEILKLLDPLVTTVGYAEIFFVPTRGRPKTSPVKKSHIFSLVWLFSRISGEEPRRRVQWDTGEGYGPLKEFVKAAIEPIHDSVPSDAALDHLIRDAVHDWKKFGRFDEFS